MATSKAEEWKPKTLILRRLVMLMLTDLEIYEDTILSEVEIKAYNWPAKYIGQTYSQALLDCTRIMLFSVMFVHCPATKL